MASTADWSFRQVFVMSFPQMSKGPQVPVKSLSSIWVMFWLLAFSQTEPANVHSVPGSTPGSGHACVPQNPGVRQISLVTHALFGVNTHPIAGSQVSSVQGLLSLHGGFGVKTHPIAGSHVSVLQALLSLPGGFGVYTHPIAGSNVSVVHALLSLHGGFGVKTHPIAGSQVSVVHALLSLHGGFGVKTHPIAGSHVSVVHALLSLQGGFGVKTHPAAGSQVSVVQALLSLHVSGVPGLQPDCVVVDAVNWTRLGVVLQPVGEALQVSMTLTPAWSFSVVGSVGTIV